MLEIGHEFERRGKKYCVLDFIDLNSKKYILFSVEQEGQKIDYEFFEISENIDGYHLEQTNDEKIINQLFDAVASSK